MLECQPRNVIRSQAESPAGPRSPASYVSHARIWSGTQTTVLLTNRSRTNTQSSQSCASAGWVDGADCSFQCWSAKSTLFMHCLPAGTRVGRQPVSAKAPLRYGCDDATSGRTRTVTPCSGGITSLGRHADSYWASDARFLVPQRTIAVVCGNGVLRDKAHYCTSTRNPTSPSPHWCFRALCDAVWVASMTSNPCCVGRGSLGSHASLAASPLRWHLKARAEYSPGRLAFDHTLRCGS